MSALVARMEAMAARITGGGVKASADPVWAHRNRPCVLVTPPTVDYSNGTLDGGAALTWRLVALANKEAGTLDAVKQLDPLVERLDEIVGIDTASPGRYPLGADKTLIAAYICQTTEYA